MGPVTFRTYHDVKGEDRSALLDQVLAQRERVRERLRDVRRVVAVMSGKGGVGKSHVTSALALALAPRFSRGRGVLDADLKGPTTALMLGARGPLLVTDEGVQPASGHEHVKVISMDLLLPEGRPLAWREPAQERFVWRGVLENGALREFLSDVVWGTLDLLLVDLPPAADRLEDLSALVPELAGALVVTIPSEESRRSVERSMHVAAEAGVPLLGVIENMSGYQCPGCEAVRPLFAGDAGEALAREFGVPLLGRIPFAPAQTAAPLPESLVARVVEVLR